MLLRPDDILHGDFWPEPVRVIALRALGGRMRIEAVGTKTQRFYSLVLSDEDLLHVRIAADLGCDFSADGERFFLVTEAHRIRNACQFDPLFAVNVSQVDPLPHQIEAVYHCILTQPRIRFLLADDPGTGKTIMTGLLLKELKYRGLVRRTLVVVPGHLKDQWVREMKERFGETFDAVDRNVINAAWGRSVWQEEQQVITSMDFAKQDDILSVLAEVHWDLVVVDEAHKMAAYRYSDKTDRTARYRLGEVLSATSQSLLFLTATPHRGDPDNFRLFLDLLHPGLFANRDLLIESVRNRDNPLFLRRLKEDIKDFEGRPLFPPRHVITKAFRLNDDEKRLYNAVTDYVQDSYNKALATEKRNVAFALLILQRRMASSVRAVRRSLERRKAKLEELLRLGQWLAERGHVDEDRLEDAPEMERLREEEELVERLTAAETREELAAEIETLGNLIHLAREAERHDVETKLNELRDLMADARVQGTREKLLIFTESRETLEYLAERLRGWGHSVTVLHGGLNLDARIRAEHEFRDRTQIMVSTEAGGEGINLQFCSLMVNYDIPWNPNRLEQRMGRVHRYGQNREVFIYNMVAEDTREGIVLRAIFDKLERIRQDTESDRVFDVIGEVIRGRSMKDLIVDAIANRRTLDDIVAEIEAEPNEEAIQRTKEASLEALATRHIDLQGILGEERRAREHRLVPEYIERFCECACRALDVPLERRRDGLWRLPSVPHRIRETSQEFRRQFGEVFREYSKVAFDKDTARRQEADFVAPGHPLLEALLERLLHDYGEEARKGAVFADPDGRLDGWLWFVECEVRDGRNEVAGKRLYAIVQPVGGAMRLVNASILWDLKPAAKDNVDIGAPAPEDDVLAFAVEEALEPYRNELLDARRRDAAIREKYGVRSLNVLIAESEVKLMSYYVRRDIPQVEVQNEKRRNEDLQARLRDLQEEIRRETSLVPSAPRILGVARVVPAAHPNASRRPDPQVEAAGMCIAMDYERSRGREPEDVSERNLGYDVCSTAADESVRYIEVKAHSTTGAVELTPNEWLMAQRLSDDYWLYVVDNALTEPALYTVQNPAAKLEAREVVEIVRYVIKNWHHAAASEESS